jgi:hypothetical protein
MRVPLTGGAYQSRSLIASAQKQLNLYSESNPEGSQAPVPVTIYLTPGLRLLGTSPNIEGVRQTYCATNGDLYVCVGPKVYFVNSSFQFTLLGTIADAQTPVSFWDNGIVVVLVDGSTNGYCIDITPTSISGKPVPRTWGQITDPNFLGSNFVDYLDTYFIFNQIGTYNLYISLSEVSFAMLTQTNLGTLNIPTPGSGYVNGTYYTVPLTGGSGTGATGTITVQGNIVTGAVVDNGGAGYALTDSLSAATSTIGGTGSGLVLTVATMSPAFDPLDIAAKSGSADIIQRVTVVFRTMWPIGTKTTEGWIDTGAADFPLQPLPGVFIEHGCIAPFSVANFDRSSFWLSQDRQGRAVVVKTQGYNAVEVSTHAIVNIFQGYANLSDAIGFTFQQNGHVFYVITFPNANATWGVDIQTGQWFEWAFTDTNGNLNRHRANCCCFAYGLNIVGDWQNGNIYALDPAVYADNGSPITRIRSFPHLIADGKRVTYTSFIADMQVGTEPGSLTSDPPMVSLRWSDDRGATYGNAVEQSMGSGGSYLVNIKWNKLGVARDRVFELSWSAATNTSLNGAFIELIEHKS